MHLSFLTVVYVNLVHSNRQHESEQWWLMRTENCQNCSVLCCAPHVHSTVIYRYTQWIEGAAVLLHITLPVMTDFQESITVSKLAIKISLNFHLSLNESSHYFVNICVRKLATV